jgi:hypothetical protein
MISTTKHAKTLLQQAATKEILTTENTALE